MSWLVGLTRDDMPQLINADYIVRIELDEDAIYAFVLEGTEVYAHLIYQGTDAQEKLCTLIKWIESRDGVLSLIDFR